MSAKSKFLLTLGLFTAAFGSVVNAQDKKETAIEDRFKMKDGKLQDSVFAGYSYVEIADDRIFEEQSGFKELGSKELGSDYMLYGVDTVQKVLYTSKRGLDFFQKKNSDFMNSNDQRATKDILTDTYRLTHNDPMFIRDRIDEQGNLINRRDEPTVPGGTNYALREGDAIYLAISPATGDSPIMPFVAPVSFASSKAVTVTAGASTGLKLKH